VSSKKRGRDVAPSGTTSPAEPGDDSAARAAYTKGNRLLLTGDTGGAISAYEEATRLAPSSPAGYRGLGLAYEKQGNSAEAARAFRRYLKLAPGSDDRALIAERLQRLAPAHKAGKRPR
jgi:Flp pilus assembly protein TadD